MLTLVEVQLIDRVSVSLNVTSVSSADASLSSSVSSTSRPTLRMVSPFGLRSLDIDHRDERHCVMRRLERREDSSLLVVSIHGAKQWPAHKRCHNHPVTYLIRRLE
ncbi:hypothetical protein BLNAU_7602 [Blattamonas nauphoetae]|uniref:Uncharacterized protein n=1 Tax=Blattamonas nauphoetae TaxID=2049346 RepID=A0ABQ9Y133_9EUKA|nr:hypothetical protein BLNAU_7602 [Blattamonas nauphoetae]